MINQKRINKEVELLLKDNLRIREIAKYIKISKSTVHKDLKEKLPKIDFELSNKVNEVLQSHKIEGYLKSGETTKNKYRLTEVKNEREIQGNYI